MLPHPALQPSSPGVAGTQLIIAHLFTPVLQAKRDAPEPRYPACILIPPQFQGTLLQKVVIKRKKTEKKFSYVTVCIE